MKLSAIILSILCCLITSVAGQTSGRVFDNFDTSRGVSIIIPAPTVPGGAKEAVKRKKNARGKWVVVVDDKLVKKTAQATPTKYTVAVTDGLANRDMTNAQYSKLLMGSASQLRGFTTGDVLIDSYIVDSSRRAS